MHPYLKLQVDENVPERTIINALLQAGLNLVIDGGTGIIRVQVPQIIPTDGKVVSLDAYRAARK